MAIVVVGLNHKSSPVSLLEQLSITDEQLPKALAHLANYEHIIEGMVLSTCNRVEVYASTTKFHGGVQDLRNFLSEFCHIAPEDFSDRLYTYHDEAALQHLFRVASGVDSMVIGESEILGQVRRAFQVATEEGSMHRVLARACTQALRVGKNARSQTEIGRNPVSISSAAVELARSAFGDLNEKRVAIVGAGKMGRLAAQALRRAGVGDVSVVNRTESVAAEVAALFAAKPVGFDRLEEVLGEADIVICSTTAPGTVVDRAMIERIVATRSGDYPLFIVDIAVPRDVEPGVIEVPGVVLKDIDDLREVVAASVGSRRGEIDKVEALIDAEIERFSAWAKATEIAPTIAALIDQAERIRRAELDSVRLSPEHNETIDRVTKRIIAKFLHDPLTKAKELASSKQGHLYLAALRELFELDDDPPGD